MRNLHFVSRKGFTIIELLIVVVVIAVLASIVIVSYQGVRARAEKTKTLAAVHSYIEALASYKVIEGSFPTTATYCLGSGYVDKTGDSTPDCRWNSGNVNPDDTFNAALNRYIKVTAPISQIPVMSGSSGVIGLYFMNDSLGKLDGAPQRDWLVYAVSDKHCGMTVPLLSDTYPEFTSKGDDNVSEEWGAGGLCWVPLQ